MLVPRGTRCGHVPLVLDQGLAQSRRVADRRPPQVRTSSTPASPSPRRRDGPVGAGSAASTRSFPTASTSSGRRRSRSPSPASCAFCSWAGRRSARACQVLLRAFEALAEHVPARLEVVGATAGEIERHLSDRGVLGRIETTARVEHDELWRRLHRADVLCAPSLRGESFGMILIEAFAAGTPVVASAIAGYAEVVTDGVEGALVPPGDPRRLAEELQRMHLEPERRRAMGAAARESAQRYGWAEVAERVEGVYDRAIDAIRCAEHPEEPQYGSGIPRSRRRRRSFGDCGLLPIDGSPRRPARRIPPLASEPPQDSRARRFISRRTRQRATRQRRPRGILN